MKPFASPECTRRQAAKRMKNAVHMMFSVLKYPCLTEEARLKERRIASGDSRNGQLPTLAENQSQAVSP
jgi:hypothetical protein